MTDKIQALRDTRYHKAHINHDSYSYMAAFDERIISGMSVFTTIVETGGFATAAKVLGMTQPGVSRSIARLEARLNTRLFERTTRVVCLTEDGRTFYEQVTPLLSGLADAARSIRNSAESVHGKLRVNMDPFFSRLILGPRLESFMDRYPDLQLELITREHIGDLVTEGFDLAIRFGFPKNSNLVAKKILDTRILTVAAPSYLQRRSRPLTAEAIVADKHVCIEYRDHQTGLPFEWELHHGQKKVPVKTNGRLIVNDVGTMLSACLAGYGIAQVMELGTESLIAEGRLVNLFPDWCEEKFPLYALHPSRLHLPAKTKAFIDFAILLTDDYAPLGAG